MDRRVINATVVLWIMTSLGAPAQPALPAGGATFEVASIKPNPSGAPQMVIRTPPSGLVTATNVSVVMLLGYTYEFPDFRILNVPPWGIAEHFDVTARGQPNASSAETRARVRSLLADRFSVVARVDKREMSVDALVRAGDTLGPGLRHSDRPCSPPGSTSEPPASQASAPAPRCLQVAFGRVNGTGMPIGDLVAALTRLTRRQVVDETALDGHYDFSLTYTPDAIALDPSTRAEFPAIDPDGPALNTALQDQLGLRLQSARRPVDVLIVQQVRPPTPD